MTKKLKIISSIFSLFILFIFIYINPPIHLKYYFKIKQGNILIDNIENYQQEFGKLPENQDYQTLEKLQFPSKNDYTNPQYQKISKTDYKLTYIKGFDCPYLMWSSQHKKWRIDCH